MSIEERFDRIPKMIEDLEKEAVRQERGTMVDNIEREYVSIRADYVLAMEHVIRAYKEKLKR